MWEKCLETLSGTRMTVISGLLLGCSLAALWGGLSLPLDPAWGAIVISGAPLVHAALTHLARGRITSSLLISLAMAASVGIGEIFAAGEIACIMAVGELLEDRTVERARKGLKRLMGLTPERGRRVTAGGEEMVPVEAIARGDVLRILPGEMIPVDGDIVAGDTSVDTSAMTGESLPVDRTVGDAVCSGTVNRFGTIDIRASRVGEDASLQKLIRMVREAEHNKAPMQRLVDVWASWLVPAALGLAVAVYWATGDMTRGVTVLVVFCPCALALATPTSIMAAIGQAARHGVIIKSGEALETMGKVDRMALDKTGTLTLGTLEVSHLTALAPGWTEKDVLRVAAAAECRSEHPLGRAVTAGAAAAGLELPPVADFHMQPGGGIGATVEGSAVCCGTERFLRQEGVVLDAAARTALDSLRREGVAAVLVAVDGRCVGLLGLSDVLRPSARSVVETLRGIQTEAVLLTGDHGGAAAWFAARAGIQEVHAGLLPAQKVERIRELQAQGHTVCMVGDGINDAPALKTADVGVAMGGMGSDIAVEAADIALMGDDIGKLPYLKKLSNAALSSIRLNIALSMGINIVAIGLSMLGWLTPVTGALVHNAGSVLVVLNAALLYDRDIR